jgi:uncharacterized protein (DUF302 family)
MNYYISKTIKGDFEQTIEYVTERLKAVGFGVLTTINVQKTLKEKIDADFKPYTILGACNPHYANKLLRIEDKLGVILPCNVVVIDQGDGMIEVAAMDPNGMMQSIQNDDLNSLAGEVRALLVEMINNL